MKKEQLFEKIAQECLRHTLKEGGLDELDFFEINVWYAKEALEIAYKAGYEAGKRAASQAKNKSKKAN